MWKKKEAQEDQEAQAEEETQEDETSEKINTNQTAIFNGGMNISSPGP
jgi:hypothetical protein